MARINIEDQFWIEVTAVTKKLGGDETRAVGEAIRLFRIAQQRYKRGQIVTDLDWKIGEFSDALLGVFAFKCEGGYEIAGGKKHFGWLEERVEAGRKGGKKSGESRRNEINNLEEANESKVEQAEPSPSYSPSLSTGKTRIKTTGPAGGGGSDFQSIGDLLAAIPEKKLSQWNAAYPDQKFQEEQARACFDHYTAPGADTPRALVGWERALSAWLKKNWEQRENRAAISGIISNIGKGVPVK